MQERWRSWSEVRDWTSCRVQANFHALKDHDLRYGTGPPAEFRRISMHWKIMICGTGLDLMLSSGEFPCTERSWSVVQAWTSCWVQASFHALKDHDLWYRPGPLVEFRRVSMHWKIIICDTGLDLMLSSGEFPCTERSWSVVQAWTSCWVQASFHALKDHDLWYRPGPHVEFRWVSMHWKIWSVVQAWTSCWVQASFHALKDHDLWYRPGPHVEFRWVSMHWKIMICGTGLDLMLSSGEFPCTERSWSVVQAWTSCWVQMSFHALKDHDLWYRPGPPSGEFPCTERSWSVVQAWTSCWVQMSFHALKGHDLWYRPGPPSGEFPCTERSWSVVWAWTSCWVQASFHAWKIMICGIGLDLLLRSGEFPYAVCRTGVGSNSIFSNGCKHWAHKKCSGLKRLTKDPDYRCTQSQGTASPLDGRP